MKHFNKYFIERCDKMHNEQCQMQRFLKRQNEVVVKIIQRNNEELTKHAIRISCYTDKVVVIKLKSLSLECKKCAEYQQNTIVETCECA